MRRPPGFIFGFSMLTAERLREVLYYNRLTGKWIWRVATSPRVHPGDEAGKMRKGYRVIGVDGKKYVASRLAFLCVKGAWPRGLVDHWDLDRANDRWSNLRDATHAQNMQNCGVRRTSSTGRKGVRSTSFAAGPLGKSNAQPRGKSTRGFVAVLSTRRRKCMRAWLGSFTANTPGLNRSAG